MRDIEMRVSCDARDALAAAALVHDAYVRRGILEPHPTRVHALAHSASPHNWTLLALERERAVGTISFSVDTGRVPMESIYGPEIASLRASGRRLAEVGGFAVDDAYRKSGLAVLLMWSLYVASRALGVERLVIAVHPKAEHVYRDALLFERIGDERSYPGLTKDARAVALASPPLETVGAHYAALTSRLTGTTIADVPAVGPIEPRQVVRREARRAIWRARPDVVAFRASLASVHEPELASR